MVICLERGADLHAAQLIPLPVTFFCFSKILIGFTFLVPAHPSSRLPLLFARPVVTLATLKRAATSFAAW